mmetsp:Transcript_44402/g.105180  ORF Transcript_44402/g.105180 Transcript_44402/m.105180 type:complete len:344 (+) Transcript_44402:88-1119(+)
MLLRALGASAQYRLASIAAATPKKRSFSSSSSSSSDHHASDLPTPSTTAPPGFGSLKQGQLRKHFVASAVPMIGFGFMDNSVMLHAGNAIDLTLGVTFGLSTLASAACGQACSDVAGVLFGGFVEGVAKRMGLPEPGFTAEEENLPVVKRVEVAGGVIGVFTGCCMGLLNLFIIDTNAAKQMKLSAGGREGEGEFDIRLNNDERPGCTAIHITGPGDVHGIIASVTTALAVYGCSIKELDGNRGDLKTARDRMGMSSYEGFAFSFWVQQDGQEVDDDKFDDLGSAILAAAREPKNIQSLAKQHAELNEHHASLSAEAERLEKELEQQLLTVRRSTRGHRHPAA